MDEDLALLSAQHTSELEADNGDVKLEEDFGELIIIADTKVHRRIINLRRGMSIRASVNGA